MAALTSPPHASIRSNPECVPVYRGAIATRAGATVGSDFTLREQALELVVDGLRTASKRRHDLTASERGIRDDVLAHFLARWVPLRRPRGCLLYPPWRARFQLLVQRTQRCLGLLKTLDAEAQGRELPTDGFGHRDHELPACPRPTLKAPLVARRLDASVLLTGGTHIGRRVRIPAEAGVGSTRHATETLQLDPAATSTVSVRL
jgi:hypothetical protein